MSRLVFPAAALLAAFAGVLAFGLTSPQSARGDVGGVYSSVPVFTPNQVVTITVTAEDDDGTLIIESSLDTSHLTVTGCEGIGADQINGQCDGAGMNAVVQHGGDQALIDTDALDSDNTKELLTITLTLTATCSQETTVTISGDQPGNHGPDDVTINCAPATPTPTPSPTASPTPSPTPTATPSATPSASPTPSPTPTFTPQPPAAPTATSTPFSEIQTVITPPSTGDAGLR